MLQLRSISVIEPSPAICPHCQEHVGTHFDVHEVLVHPEQRERLYPPEFKAWKADQAKKLTKKKKV